MNINSTDIVSVLLVCHPGLEQKSLSTALQAIPGVLVVGGESSIDTALRAAEQLAPDVLLVDALLLDKDMALLLEQAKALLPEMALAVLIMSASQATRWRQEGADFAIGYSELNEQFPQILSHVRNRKDEQAK